jgi:hypothetical protein
MKEGDIKSNLTKTKYEKKEDKVRRRKWGILKEF